MSVFTKKSHLEPFFLNLILMYSSHYNTLRATLK